MISAKQKSGLLDTPARWLLAAGSILVVAAFLRVYSLALRPLHHDEGVNSYFLLALFREGVYRYNAANYHGPTLYYLAMISSSINNLFFGVEGPSTIALRMVTATAGAGLVALIFSLRTLLGRMGALIAAASLAISPGLVYLSRDFIHEILLVFFTLWLVICAARFLETGESRQILLGFTAAALMFSTKETAPISLFAIAVAAGVAVLWVPDPTLRAGKYGGWRRLGFLAVGGSLLFLAMTFLCFSSFFANYPQGVRDALTTYSYWVRTGMTQQRSPWYRYLTWMAQEESVILCLAVLGTIVAFVRRNRFGVFAATWAFVLLAVYSVLPYKTPWILLNMLLPMGLLAGVAAQSCWDHVTGARAKAVVLVLLAASASFSLYQCIELNFFHYDDSRYVYPFVQTNRGFLQLVEQVQQIAKASPQGNQIGISVFSPEYWPLPWYLRDYKNTGYIGKVADTDTAMVIASSRQYAEVRRALHDRYRFVGAYPLRPGVELLLYTANGQNR